MLALEEKASKRIKTGSSGEDNRVPFTPKGYYVTCPLGPVSRFIGF